MDIVDTARDAARYHFVPGGRGGLGRFPTVVGGEGCWLYTDDGRRILDAAGGAIVVNIGHGRREVADAVRAALDGGAYVVPIWPTPHRLRLHDVLVERWLPDGMQNVFFTSGGSESADSALRLARATHLAQGRDTRWKVIGRHPSYHGITLGALAVGSHSGRRAGYDPLLLDFPKVPWDDVAALKAVIERQGPDTIAGFLFEPIVGAAGGCLVAPDDYWRAVEEICRRHDILLIADEVMTGFGRTGRRWGHEHFPIRPDIIYGGKGLGGGYVPIGMVAATAEVVEPLAASGFMYFTFTGADAVCAGATAVLDIVESERLVERSAAMGDLLEARLEEGLGAHPHVADIRGRGLFRGIELVRDRGSGEPFPVEDHFAFAVVRECLARDVWVYPAGSGPVRDAVMIGCPFTISESEVDLLVDTLAVAINAAAAAATVTTPR
jgi:adenosylmethionine-8-amino-7-oxononanoate aminotransferase